MKLLRTLSTSRLVLLIVAVVALAAAGAAIAVAASGGSGSTPAPKPLAQALHDSLAGTAPYVMSVAASSRTGVEAP